jgi:cell fate (sporulation/competence/biofilm development) regulator YlbF (YheA/YmcA/DUF963 family)
MDHLIKKADELGRSIAASERFKSLRTAEDAVGEDEATRKVLEAANAQRDRLARLEAEQKPIEPADKREMERLNQAVHGNEKLQALAKAQADYLEMMNKVNEAIRAKLE